MAENLPKILKSGTSFGKIVQNLTDILFNEHADSFGSFAADTQLKTATIVSALPYFVVIFSKGRVSIN